MFSLESWRLLLYWKFQYRTIGTQNFSLLYINLIFSHKKPGSRSASGFHESGSATPLLIVITYDVPLFQFTCINKIAFQPTIGTPKKMDRTTKCHGFPQPGPPGVYIVAHPPPPPLQLNTVWVCPLEPQNFSSLGGVFIRFIHILVCCPGPILGGYPRLLF